MNKQQKQQQTQQQTVKQNEEIVKMQNEVVIMNKKVEELKEQSEVIMKQIIQQKENAQKLLPVIEPLEKEIQELEKQRDSKIDDVNRQIKYDFTDIQSKREIVMKQIGQQEKQLEQFQFQLQDKQKTLVALANQNKEQLVKEEELKRQLKAYEDSIQKFPVFDPHKLQELQSCEEKFKVVYEQQLAELQKKESDELNLQKEIYIARDRLGLQARDSMILHDIETVTDGLIAYYKKQLGVE